MRRREEVLNTTLAEILTSYGLPAEPETIVSGKLPDVMMMIMGGLKVIIEGKESTSRKALEEQAQTRLEAGLADISIALVYPKTLYEVGEPGDLRDKMDASRYSGTVYYWSRKGITMEQFVELSIKELAEVLNHAYGVYIQNDLLATKITEIEDGITRLTGEGQQRSLAFYSPAVQQKLRKALGIGESDGEEE